MRLIKYLGLLILLLISNIIACTKDTKDIVTYAEEGDLAGIKNMV